MIGPGPVDQLVQHYCIPLLKGARGVGGKESLAVGHGDCVDVGRLMGAVALEEVGGTVWRR